MKKDTSPSAKRQRLIIRIGAGIIILTMLLGIPLALAKTNAPASEDKRSQCPPPAEFVPTEIMNVMDPKQADTLLGTVYLDTQGTLVAKYKDGSVTETEHNPIGGYRLVFEFSYDEGDTLVIGVIHRTVFVCDGVLYARVHPTPTPALPSSVQGNHLHLFQVAGSQTMAGAIADQTTNGN